jgi:Secretion system C-terminal sorting domain
MTHKVSFTIIILFLIASSSVATEVPWIISNVHPDGRMSLLHDYDGNRLSEITYHLIHDVDGDGAAPANHLDLDAIGMPTGDDILVTSGTIQTPIEDFLPEGGISLITQIDISDENYDPENQYYIRVFESNDLQINTYYSDSNLIYMPGDNTGNGSFSYVEFPSLMKGYIGNEYFWVTSPPANMMFYGGETLSLNCEVTGEEDSIFVSIDPMSDVPGGNDQIILTRTSELSYDLAWRSPIHFVEPFVIRVNFDDGQFSSTFSIAMFFGDPHLMPRSFNLVTPEDEKPAFVGNYISWEATEHPDDEAVLYAFYWSLNEDFSDADSVVGLTDTSLIIDEAPEPFRTTSNPNDNLNSKNRSKISENMNSAEDLIFSETQTEKKEITESFRRDDETIANSNKSRENSSNSSFNQLVLDEDLNLNEGDRFYWKVRAYTESGTERWSQEVRTAYYETPDSPESFSLLTPTDGSILNIPDVEFKWFSSVDPDMGDVVKYDLIWSVDNWIVADTIFALSDTLFHSENSMNDGEGFTQFYQTVSEQILEKLERITNPDIVNIKTVPVDLTRETSNSEMVLDSDLPQDIEISWKVDAVDLADLRVASNEVRDFSIAIPEGPQGFDLLSPSDGVWFDRLRAVTLSWSRSFDFDPGATVRYDLMISSNPELNDPREFETVITGLDVTSHLFDSSVNDDRVWRWSVRSISDEDTVWANTTNPVGYNSFTISEPDIPSNFTLIAPEDGGTIAEFLPEFEWEEAIETDVGDSVVYTLFWSIDEWVSVDSVTGILETEHLLTDSGFDNNQTVWWIVKATDSDSNSVWSEPDEGWSFTIFVSDIEEFEEVLPTEFAIEKIYPNPFNPTTEIVISLPERSYLKVDLYNVIGQRVETLINNHQAAGRKSFILDGNHLASGIYFVHAYIPGRLNSVKKVLLVR